LWVKAEKEHCRDVRFAHEKRKREKHERKSIESSLRSREDVSPSLLSFSLFLSPLLALPKDGSTIWDEGRRTAFLSQEHTPRQQEHAATPLERGPRSKAEERRFGARWNRGKRYEVRGKTNQDLLALLTSHL